MTANMALAATGTTVANNARASVRALLFPNFPDKTAGRHW